MCTGEGGSDGFRFALRVAAGGAGPLGRGDGAGAVAVSPDGSLLVTSPGPGRVMLWRARDLAVAAELRGPYGGAQSLAFSHDGRLVAATGNGRETVVWDIRIHKIDRLLGPAGHGGNIGVSFSPDDRIVGTAGEDGTVRLYDVRTGRRVAKLIARGTEQDLDFSSDGRLVAAAGLGEQISIWNARTDSLERTIDHDQLIFAMRFSPDGSQIATGDVKGNVDFWDVATGRRVGREIGGYNGAVISVTYSPDGKEIMTTSSDGKFRLIDIATGKLVGAPLPGDGGAGWGTFFPDGKQIVVALWSGDGAVWNVDPSAWAAQACRIAHRNLTPAEWRDFLPARPYRRIVLDARWPARQIVPEQPRVVSEDMVIAACLFVAVNDVC